MTNELKGSGIEVGQDYEKTPPIICPYCGGDLHLMIDGFKPDITKIVKSNCPSCGGEIFACLLIITDVSLKGVVASAQAVSNAFDEAKRKIIPPYKI